MDKVLRFKQVQEATGLSRATICRRIRKGEFPKPFDLGGGLLGFSELEISSWLEDRRRVVPRHGASKDEAKHGVAP